MPTIRHFGTMQNFFTSGTDDAALILPMTHDPALVALSLLVAVLTSLVALHTGQSIGADA